MVLCILDPGEVIGGSGEAGGIMAQAESAELPYNPVSFTPYDCNDLSDLSIILYHHIRCAGNAFRRWSPSKYTTTCVDRAML